MILKYKGIKKKRIKNFLRKKTFLCILRTADIIFREVGGIIHFHWEGKMPVAPPPLVYAPRSRDGEKYKFGQFYDVFYA